jgi:hypothetical protein
MSPRTRKRLLLICLVGTVFAAGLILGYRAWDQREMLRVTLIWARLAPLPASAKDFRIATEGGMFTRSFRASFTAPLGDIERWLRDSPGTRDITPFKPSSSSRKFIISPGEGANQAEVTVDDITGAVRIYVSWS